ncbi:MAG: D-glycerate dehydrogenase [Candidatus Cloacimonadota bacterium]|nr:D-glycerate dehydrogenase [Candidatus Cloacimonadota bacterium]
MKSKVFITKVLAKPIIEELQKNFEIRYNNSENQLNSADLVEGVKWADFLFCQLSDKIDKTIIQANPNLKGIINYAVGYNNIDVGWASKNNIPVCNTPEVLTETTADLVWALIFAVSRRIVESDKFVREGNFAGWGSILKMGNDIFGKTLGIVGAGRIGQAVAKRASGFNMNILYYNRSEKAEMERIGAKKEMLGELLKQSDIVSINLPLTLDTKHLFDKEEFELMKNNAILINTARGEIINEIELVKALETNKIFGAGLDVYENEPTIETKLLTMDNVVLLPHIGSASIETRLKMGTLCIESIKKLADNKIPKNVVNDVIRS